MRRRLPDDELAKRIREVTQKCLMDCAADWPKGCMKRKFMEIACGQCKSNPFDPVKVQEAKTALCRLLTEAGLGDGRVQAGDRPQSFDTRLIQGLLRAFRDPDHHFCEWGSKGVWLGSDQRRLPRTPAVFERKRRWRFKFPEENEWSEWRPNYSSAEEN